MAEQHSTQEGQQQSLLAYHSSPPSRKRKQEFQYPHIFDQHHHHQQQQRQQQQPQPTYSQSSSSWTYLQQQQSSDSSVAVDTLSSRLDEHQQPQGLGNWHVLTPSFHQQQHDPSRRSSSPFSGSNQFSRPVDQVPSSTSSSNTETTLRSQTNLDFFPPDDISGERRDTIFKQEDIDLSFGLPTLPHDTTGSGAVYHHEPSSYADRSTARQLRLTDIDSIHERGQQQLIQSWVGGRSANATPTTPAFFSPGFLDSLQQDDEPQALAQSTPYALQHVDWQQQQEQQQQQQQQQEQHDQGVSAAFHEFSSFAAVDAMSVPSSRPATTDSNKDASRYYQSTGYSLSSPESPAPSPSTTAGSTTPVYGRLSNLSLRSGNMSRHQSPSTHLPPTIPESEEDLIPRTTLAENNQESIDRRALKAGLVTARIMRSAASTAKLLPFIQSYLQMPDPVAAGEKTVMVLTSKVAQKSYGTEKRFLCPPPTAILIGTSWWTCVRQIYHDPVIGEQQETADYHPPRLTICISSEALSHPGQIEWYASSGTAVGVTGHPKQIKQDPQQQQQHPVPIQPNRFKSPVEEANSHDGLDWSHNHEHDPLAAGRCVAKNLHINDADEKRKRVECLVRIQLGDGVLLGTLASKGIKVISKPSKKRQSVKNMELCIHHGTTISLFNRIRSQTVSTKYLCVSNGSAFAVPGFQLPALNGQSDAGTCFVARTSGWDPFVIWIVDTTRAPNENQQESERPEDYVGNPLFLNRGINYPPPPAIALKNTTDQPIPIHYNQHIVLQCLTTGLVSPVMIIRKVDKASTVVGGARWQMDEPHVAGGGGEFGDEVLGDPVSQLHKVALQIVQDPARTFQQQSQQSHYSMEAAAAATTSWMMPRSIQPVTYLACLNDMVGMHKTTEPRKPVQTSWDGSDVTSQEGGKVVRKRRVSSDQPPNKLVSSMSLTDLTTHHHQQRQQESSSSPLFYPRARSNSMDHRRSSISRRMSVSSTGSSSGGGGSNSGMGAFWSEDVSDAAVWTIVGTDCATYKFMAQQPPSNPGLFPFLTHYTSNNSSEDGSTLLTLHGENFSRDLQVWLGDVRASQTEYRSRELLLCRVPNHSELLETCFGEKHPDESTSLPILLIKGDGPVVYKTNHSYRFS